MVLLLSLALVMAPNFRPGQNVMSGEGSSENSNDLSRTDVESIPIAGRSRSLLHQPAKSLETSDDELLDILSTEVGPLQDHDYEPPLKLSRSLHPNSDYSLYPKRVNEPKSVAGEAWRPPPKPGEDATEQIFTEEMKVNISDPGGTRTVLLQVPKST